VGLGHELPNQARNPPPLAPFHHAFAVGTFIAERPRTDPSEPNSGTRLLPRVSDGKALRVYIDAAGIAEDRKGWLFRTARGHKGSALSDKPMSQSDAWRMICRRAVAAGIAEAIGCHTFRATGITAYLANGGALEHAQEMAAHESPRTTKLYDRTKERLTQDEVERIRL